MESLDGYTATFEKTERIAGTLSEAEIIQLKLRQKPTYGIYLKWLNADAGRQVLYSDDYKDNQMVVKLGGLKGRLLPAIKIDASRAEQILASRYPLTQIGLRSLLHRIQAVCHDLNSGISPPQCQRQTDVEIDSVSCVVFAITFTSKERSPEIQSIVVILDKGHGIPVGYRAYSWGTGEETLDELLLESYSFHDIDFTSGTAAEDFSRENPTFRF
jgi:hypothetical protein